MINLWVRANLEQANEETRALLPESDHAQYEQVMANLGLAAVALSEAQLAYQAALAEREAFFKGRAYD